MHLTCGTSTHIVTSDELSSARMHDSPYFKTLVEQTAKAGFTMREIRADKGYISSDNLQTVIDHGATPYIPFKTNTTGKSGSELWLRLFHYNNFKREAFLTPYHKRSNVETTFSMIKAKFGERLRSKTETAQVNEALCKVRCHNLCVVIQSMYELGIAPEFTSEAA